MLMKSGINPFDSTETKAYKGNPEVLAMTNLVRSVCVGGDWYGSVSGKGVAVVDGVGSGKGVTVVGGVESGKGVTVMGGVGQVRG